jgi:hypothetical protein
LTILNTLKCKDKVKLPRKRKTRAEKAIIYNRLMSLGLIVNLNLPKIEFPSFLLLKSAKKRKAWVSFFRKTSVNRFLIRIPMLCETVYGVNPRIVTRFIIEYVRTYENLCIHNSPEYAVKWLKSLHGITARHLCNHKYVRMPYISHSSDGLPSILHTLSPLITGSIEERKCVCFLIQLYKLAKVPNFTDLTIETIIHEEETDTTNTPSEGAYLRKAAINCGYSLDYANTIAYSYCQVLEELFPKADEDKRLNHIRDMNSIHISTKNGPKAKSLLTPPIDWLAVRKDKALGLSSIELSR